LLIGILFESSVTNLFSALCFFGDDFIVVGFARLICDDADCGSGGGAGRGDNGIDDSGATFFIL
jgi:hypothetical protein